MINVDSFLPVIPDFLKNQIRRMHDMEQVEKPVFGKENKDLSKQELKYQEQD